MEPIIHQVSAQGGFISTVDLPKQSDYQRLVRAKKRGELIKIRHGVYAVPDAVFSTMIDVGRIVPHGIVCLYSAWAYHQLSTVVPPSFCIAIEAKRKIVMSKHLPIELYYWKKENLEFGIMDTQISGFNIHITDLERSVCDAIKYRNKTGLDITSEIIRNYLKKENRNLSRLSEYAKQLRVAKKLREYMEIALE